MCFSHPAQFISPPAPPRRGPQGFTMIELLVVIAIVAVLAALAFTVTGNIKSRMDIAQATSNLRHLGSAFILHAGDNNGALPYSQEVRDGMDYPWDRALETYLEPGYWRMGRNTDNQENAGFPWNPSKALLVNPLDQEVRFGRSYSMVRANLGNANAAVNGAARRGPGRGTDPALRLVEVEKPASTILLTDRFHNGQSAGFFSNADMSNVGQQNAADPTGEKYQGKYQYLFVGGNVQYTDQENTFGPGGTVAAPRGAWTLNPHD